MKKLLSIILALVMMLSLVACGGDNEDSEEKKSSKKNKQSSYETVVKRLMNAIEELDEEAYVNYLSEYIMYVVPEYYAEKNGEDFDRDEAAKDNAENINSYFLIELDKYFNKKVGRDYSLSYKIRDSYEPAEYEYRDLWDDYDIYGEDEDEPVIAAKDYWEKVMVVEIKLTGKKGSKSKTVDIEYTLAKEKSGWKVVSQDCSQIYYYSDSETDF